MNPCKVCGHEATEQHHIYKRGTHPELIDEPKNLVWLCHHCHHRTETDIDFLTALQAIFYDWRSANVDLFMRAQATIESIEQGKGWEFYTPQMVDAALKLATAQFSHLNEQLTKLEQDEAKYYGGLLQEKTSKARMEMEWRITTDGQEQIAVERKVKVLEKIMSSMKASLRRLEIEYHSYKHV